MNASARSKNESNIFAQHQWDQTNEFCFFLTSNVFDFNCGKAQYFSTEAWVEFILDALNTNNAIDGLPYFMLVHAEDNHRANGWFSFVIDRYFRRLLEYA